MMTAVAVVKGRGGVMAENVVQRGQIDHKVAEETVCE
jgi:hypothetical protein